ncbi:hypothetical protein C8D83_101250 [Halothiobacillus neapolitanus]|nr:hypothetical protein C8D83_101250 [Halothiobacillus neapolitanus]
MAQGLIGKAFTNYLDVQLNFWTNGCASRILGNDKEPDVLKRHRYDFCRTASPGHVNIESDWFKFFVQTAHKNPAEIL